MKEERYTSIEFEAKESIEKINKWNSLSFLEKVCRVGTKPSGVDYRIINLWLKLIEEMKDKK